MMDLEASNIVKPVRVLLSLLMVAAVLFASASSVSAIGFDAEKAYESVFVVYSGTSLGSGFAIGENCVITNAHVMLIPIILRLLPMMALSTQLLRLALTRMKILPFL